MILKNSERSQFSKALNQKYHKSDKEYSDESLSKNTEARDIVHVRNLRRSKHVKEHSYEIYAKEKDKEEVLNSSHQFTSTISQSSLIQQFTTQQLSSQQSAISPIIINPVNIKPSIAKSAQSQYSILMVRQILSDNCDPLINIKAMLIKHKIG
ncbi:hypothetical protein C1645_817014 [Glomus cerebriforme]|uniref:Uncharacterized protein n=1 Tax=Glomus cerebriforme TaxID=658196 RepID=A0A397TA76_9GLOM|nr:hypothetical protein C1645_817014 [Glomus cerebriforme]